MSEHDAAEPDRMPSGIGGLDVILRGGFLRGGLYIIQGAPGTGKTTLANQICFHQAADGRRALYFTLLAERHAHMMRHLGSMSFFDPSMIPDQVAYLGAFTILRRDGIRGLLDMLRREIVAGGATMLILDGLAAAQRVAGDDQAFAEFVHELQGIAIATDCTMFLLTSSEGARSAPEYTIVDGIVQLSERMVGWAAESALQVIKLRGTGFLRGRHAFRITGDGVVVHPRLEALLARPSHAEPGPTTKVSSGLGRLDAMLGGGVPTASATLLLGASGVGKTTFGLHFLSRCTTDEPGLLFGFYETPSRISAKVDQVCRGLRPALDDGTVDVVWQPTNDLLDAYGERLLQAVRRRGVRRLFLDGVVALQEAISEPARVGKFLTVLTNELRVLGVTTFYTMETPNVEGPVLPHRIDDYANLAENLVLLRYVEQGARLHRIISILKVRDSGFDPSLHGYAITDRGVEIEDTPSHAAALLSGQAPPRRGA